ncbi:hypothetical protein EG850_01890 [Gulosibacter macacae]|uniref:DUF6458 domain-containing protein n=1 Tax=Gulosibacter macacae TaxID=2488791 RepID=A0A3P3VZR5_9MICO|nr:DUF6458 family protein [Gulosibacter macacae]RRJ88220.1 hypothetical protein EG850_01890 [Gulosibacter macacae]
MSIGFGVFLIVIGAILVYAVDFQLSGVDLTMIGYILMGAGVVVSIIGLALLFRRRSASSTQRSAVDPATGERVTRTEHSQSGDEVL